MKTAFIIISFALAAGYFYYENKDSNNYGKTNHAGEYLKAIGALVLVTAVGTSCTLLGFTGAEYPRGY